MLHQARRSPESVPEVSRPIPVTAAAVAAVVVVAAVAEMLAVDMLAERSSLGELVSTPGEKMYPVLIHLLLFVATA